MKKPRLNVTIEDLWEKWLATNLEIAALQKALVKAGVLTEEHLRQGREETKREAQEELGRIQSAMNPPLDPTKKKPD